MQVILLRDVSGVGQKGSIKTVSDGHALNFLIPNGMAEMVTADRVKAHTKKQEEDALAAEMQERQWKELVAKLNNAQVSIQANASEQGHLYEKISNIQIAGAISTQLKYAIPPAAIEPKMPLKELGEWPVNLRLGNHTATLIVVVRK